MIEVTFEINAKCDSVILPDFAGFTVLSGPNKRQSVSYTNGGMTVREAHTYRLQPLKSGQLTISSPVYYCIGKTITAEAAIITVDPSALTAQDQQEIATTTFIENRNKPLGTIRITHHEDMAYMEIVGERGWEFYRRLTAEELERIQTIR